MMNFPEKPSKPSPAEIPQQPVPNELPHRPLVPEVPKIPVPDFPSQPRPRPNVDYLQAATNV